MNKVLIVVGEASETLDTLYPCLRVQEEGLIPIVAGPKKRRYNMVLHEVPAGWDITCEREGYKIDRGYCLPGRQCRRIPRDLL